MSMKKKFNKFDVQLNFDIKSDCIHNYISVNNFEICANIYYCEIAQVHYLVSSLYNDPDLIK